MIRVILYVEVALTCLPETVPTVNKFNNPSKLPRWGDCLRALPPNTPR